MTKNTNINEIKVAIKAGHYANLNTREQKIYSNAFTNGYNLAKKHLQINEKCKNCDSVKIVGYSFSFPQRSTIDNIIDYICKRYEVSKIELLGKKRTLDIVRARNIIHNLLSEKYKMNLTSIGKYFKQDHTTVLHSIKMKLNKQRYWSEEQTIWQEFQELKEVL
jgi:chromosomal replication initiation ATPase DnaA